MTINVTTTQSDEASHDGDSIKVEDGVLYVQKSSASGYPDTVALYAPGAWIHAEVRKDA